MEMASTERTFSLNRQINYPRTDLLCSGDFGFSNYGKNAPTSRPNANFGYLIENGQSEGICSDFQKEYSKIKGKLEEYRCPICMEVLLNTSIISCGHRFCLYCIKQWFHHSHPKRFCPVCRKNCVYYQDDGETDINISNLYRCLPVSDQEERNIIIIDREYASGIPNNRLPQPENISSRIMDDLNPWRSQYTSATDAPSYPFDVESMNPMMAENYYPSFLPYLPYEQGPFPELEYHERSLSAPLHPALPSDPHPDWSHNYQQNPSDSSYLHSSNVMTSRSFEPKTNAPVDLAYSAAGYMQRPGQQMGMNAYGGFAGNDPYSAESLGIETLAGNRCTTAYPSIQAPSQTLGNSHDGNLLPQSAPPVNYSTDLQQRIPTWSHFSDQNPNNYNPALANMTGGFNPTVNHPVNHSKQNCMGVPDVRAISSLPDNRELYHIPEAPIIENNWDLPALSTLSTDGHRSRYSRRFANPPNTTYEDYQQDVLIQEEFQRLDEMLLRDDDEVCTSENDQVSVESVVSSEQQYDSPWEVGSSQTRSKTGASAPTPSEKQAHNAPSSNPAEKGNLISTTFTTLTSRPSTEEEFQPNFDPRIELQTQGTKANEKKQILQDFTSLTKKLPEAPPSDLKGFRSKIIPKLTLDMQRKRHRMEDIRLQNKPMDFLQPPPIDFRQLPLTTRRSTPSLQKIKSDPRTKKVISVKTSQTSQPSPSVLQGAIAPKNMMGVSYGDGVWSAAPEMTARVYLPHGMLLTKMEYQPYGSGNGLNFLPSPNLQEQHQQRNVQKKFSHPVIHVLPLSTDGSTRINITFDLQVSSPKK